MITRIEIDGFKTFQKFAVDLEPFQVIAGPNGVGKTNLFDALRLLSHLAELDLRSAFQEVRGEAGELFTQLPDGTRAARMQLAVELLVDNTVQDQWGQRVELSQTRLRYEIVLTRETDEYGLDRLSVQEEGLTPIRKSDDSWANKHLEKNHSWWSGFHYHGRGRLPYIATVPGSQPRTIVLQQDGHGGGKRPTVAERMERTVLSGIVNTEFPHAFAVREEMRSWKFLQLNPEVLRLPSSLLAPTQLGFDGSNLASTLARIDREDKFALRDISRDLANLVPGLIEIQVAEDRVRDIYVVWATMQDGRRFSSRVLSDGTLRLLALAVLKNDLNRAGVACFEEPENGVHPFRVRQMVELLRGLSSDVHDEADQGPIRQLLVNTHSPVFVAQLEDYELLFADAPVRVSHNGDGQGPQQVTRMFALSDKWPLSESDTYTHYQIERFLNSGDWEQATARLVGGTGA